MANTFAVLTALEISLAATDKPMLGTNALKKTDRLEWRDATGDTFNLGSDISDSTAPTNRLIDNKSNLVSNPNTTFTHGHVLIDTQSNPIEFDFFAIVNHNLGTIGGGGTITVDVADDEDFSVNLRTAVASITVAAGDNKRLSDLVLFHTGSTALRYTGVEFIRVHLAGFTSGTPFFGELIFGRRRQLEFKPTLSYGPDNLASDVDDFVSKTRVMTRHIRAQGYRELNANLNPSTDPFRTDLITFYKTESNFGTVPFIWIEDPNARPREFNWMLMDPPAFNFPLVGPFERNLQLVATEQGPNFLALDKF